MSAPAYTGWRAAVDAQMGVWRWLATDVGKRWFAAHCASTCEPLQPETVVLTRTLYSTEPARLLSADPIYVSAEMCELVAAASKTFEPEPLIPSDMLVPFGFLLYERPFLIPDRFDDPTTIAAVSWQPIMAGEDAPRDPALREIDMASYAAKGFEAEWRDERHGLTDGEGDGYGIALTLYCLSNREQYGRETGGHEPPAIIPMHITPWYFGMTFDGNEIDENGVPTGAAWWWKILQTTFRLMQQRITVRHEERPDRGARREAKRLGLPERPVVVVRLRREKGESEPSGEGAHYSHRFIVGAHWRNAWFPSVQTHRQIWIGPYVKGPADKELVVKPRRYVWNR